ncbi:MAG: hypothetical protein ACI9K2_006281 [Myxococcota bacterium]
MIVHAGYHGIAAFPTPPAMLRPSRRWSIGPEVRALLRWLAVLIPLTVLVFLLASGFFVSWRGHAVSTRVPRTDDASSYTVLIVSDDGTHHERNWPAAVVEALNLPVDSLGVPPASIGENLPHTVKTRFQLQYHVALPDGTTRTVPTTTPQAVGVAVLFFLLGVFLRNMMHSGSPFSLEPKGVTLPKAQAPVGAPAPRKPGAGGRKGPPPPKPRRGAGRR